MCYDTRDAVFAAHFMSYYMFFISMIFSKLFGKKDEMVTCDKCGKQKKASDAMSVDGGKYCCTACCGDTSKGEHTQKKASTCEFC